jgi:hypothetical protein
MPSVEREHAGLVRLDGRKQLVESGGAILH